MVWFYGLTCPTNVITYDIFFLDIWGRLGLNWGRIGGSIVKKSCSSCCRYGRPRPTSSPDELGPMNFSQRAVVLLWRGWQHIVVVRDSNCRNLSFVTQIEARFKCWKANAQSYIMVLPYEMNFRVWMMCEYMLWSVCIIAWLIIHVWWWISVEMI